MRKRALSFILIVAFLIPVGTLAAGPEQSEMNPLVIRPMYEGIDFVTSNLTVKGKTASYSLKVTGASNVTKIVATLQIQKQNSNGTYSNFGSSWNASSSSRTLNTSGDKTVDSGGTYRLKATIKLYTGSSYSTEVVYS